ncbi:flagellar hook-basal body complex protein FliE [Alcanivorax sp. MM125-6]|nr:flagellar hook-basal body complex protein FliE [Alcanivorax sp. MM125-6]
MSAPAVSPAMQAALNQMQELSAQAGTGPAGERVNATVGSGGFTDALQSSLERINQLQMESGDKARAFQAGEPGVELHDVMITGQKASVAFEMGKQVRNRLVTAYKDIMNMQV